jgi:aspartyl-tRNA(Asn)/glutamyl-tRNA(Gln) amidotransferase subunit B
MASGAYEAVVGLEVHTHLMTRSKLFCGCSTSFGAAANNNVCPVCMAMPGVLPVLNRRAVELAIRMGLAAHCEIAPRSIFARKSYFYPDLPKGYQISQYELPICKGGYIEIPADERSAGLRAGDVSEPRRIRLVRIHLEEDAGKNIHEADYSLVDFNRSCVPLIEIVSEPDIRGPEEAGGYLRELRAILRYVDASDGRMEEGSFRCDVNVSVKKRGAAELGVRTEIKNLNSFRFVEKAIEYEVNRQIELIDSGGRIAQETLLWDTDRQVTRPMRSKEFANDYRYFPEPDLPPLMVSREMVEQVASSMPELPAARRARYAAEFGLSPYDANVLTAEREVADYFEAMIPGLTNRKAAANWVMTEVLRVVNETGKSIAEAVPKPDQAGALLKMVEQQKISLNAAKTAFAAMCKSGQSAEATVAALGLAQVSDDAAIAAACDKVLAAETAKVAEYRGGRDKLFGFFVGMVMKEMGGRGNPKMVNEVLKRKLAE